MLQNMHIIYPSITIYVSIFRKQKPKPTQLLQPHSLCLPYMGATFLISNLYYFSFLEKKHLRILDMVEYHCSLFFFFPCNTFS